MKSELDYLLDFQENLTFIRATLEDQNFSSVEELLAFMKQWQINAAAQIILKKAFGA